MTGNKKWFSSLTPLLHKEYVTFGDDKKGEVLDTRVIHTKALATIGGQKSKVMGHMGAVGGQKPEVTGHVGVHMWLCLNRAQKSSPVV
jgi:hypothetical protein